MNEKLEEVLDIITKPYNIIEDFLRDLKYGIKNFWFYRKVIYNDRWFDHSYMLILMEKKLEQMDKGWDHAHYLNSEVQQKEMQEARILLKKLITDDFLEDAQKDMDEKYGKLEINEDESNETLLFLRGGKLETPEQEVDWRESLKVATNAKNRAERELFKLLSKFNYWWD